MKALIWFVMLGVCSAQAPVRKTSSQSTTPTNPQAINPRSGPTGPTIPYKGKPPQYRVIDNPDPRPGDRYSRTADDPLSIHYSIPYDAAEERLGHRTGYFPNKPDLPSIAGYRGRFPSSKDPNYIYPYNAEEEQLGARTGFYVNRPGKPTTEDYKGIYPGKLTGVAKNQDEEASTFLFERLTKHDPTNPPICAYILSTNPEAIVYSLYGPKVKLAEIVEMLLFRPETTGSVPPALLAKRRALLPKFLMGIQNTLLKEYRFTAETHPSDRSVTQLSIRLPLPTEKVMEDGTTWNEAKAGKIMPTIRWRADVPPESAWLVSAFRIGSSYSIICQPWTHQLEPNELGPNIRRPLDKTYKSNLPQDQQGKFVGFDIIAAITEMLPKLPKAPVIPAPVIPAPVIPAPVPQEKTPTLVITRIIPPQGNK